MNRRKGSTFADASVTKKLDDLIRRRSDRTRR